MSTTTISELKARPASAILDAEDYPVAILKRNKTQAYIVGKELFEKLISAVEDTIDKNAIKNADFKGGKEFEDLASELGI